MQVKLPTCMFVGLDTRHLLLAVRFISFCLLQGSEFLARRADWAPLDPQ